MSFRSSSDSRIEKNTSVQACVSPAISDVIDLSKKPQSTHLSSITNTSHDNRKRRNAPKVSCKSQNRIVRSTQAHRTANNEQSRIELDITPANKSGNSSHAHCKPFKCPYPNCSNEFRQKSNLKTHMNAIHTHIIEFNCSKCIFKTYYKYYYKKHLQRFHGEYVVFRSPKAK